MIDFVQPAVKRPRPILVRFLMTLGFVGLVLLAGGVGWALLAYFLERMSLVVAFLIGLGVAIAYTLLGRPAGVLRLSLFFAACVASTLASILLGHYVLTVLLVIRDLDFSLGDALLAVALKFDLVLGSGDTAVGLVLGFIGSVLGCLAVVRRRA